MRKVFIIASLVLAACVCQAQPITDTGALRYYINSTIVPNGNRQITAAQLNRILNGTINVMPWSAGKASYGLRKSGDTTMLGGRINGIAGLIIPNRQTSGSVAGNLLISNRQTPDSLCIECTPTGTGTNVSGSITESPTYNTPQLSITTAYREAWGDLVSPQQYGGAIEIDTRRIYKATGSAHSVAGGGVVQMPVAGLGVHNRIYLPNDSTVTPNWGDGTNCTIRGNMDVGLPGGYLWHILAPTSYTPQAQPHYQLPVYSSQVDLQRQSYMTGRRKLIGAGIAGYQSMFKSEQRTLNTGQTNLHHDIDAPMVGFNAVGMVDNDLRGSGVSTKTDILDRSRVGNVYGFRAAAMRRPFNEVDNGYGFVAVGDSDVNHFAGPTRVGGTLPYWNAGVLTQQRMFEVYGASYADSVYAGTGAKMYTDGSSTDRRFWIYPSGSNVRMIFGRGGNESATMQIAGTNVGDGYDNRGGLSITTRTYNQGSNYERAKFLVAVDDVGTFMRKLIIDKDNISLGYQMGSDASYTGAKMRINSAGVQLLQTQASSSVQDSFLVKDGSGTIKTTGKPYISYTALISQTGTDAPTVTVLQNEIGSIVWTRTDAGRYVGTLSGAFPSGKTFVVTPSSVSPAFLFAEEDQRARIKAGRMSSNTVEVQSSNNAGSPDPDNDVRVDDLLSDHPIEIRVYP